MGLALLALHGGEKQYKKNKKNKNKNIIKSNAQKQAETDTTKLLIKDCNDIINNKLDTKVKNILSNCILLCQQQQHDNLDIDNITINTTTINNNNENKNKEEEEQEILWNKYLDSNVLETLYNFKPIEAQIAVVDRLYDLLLSPKSSSSSFNINDINLSSSLSGIIRTIKKYGYNNKKQKDIEKDD